jgi:hypothetical protein
MNHFRKIGEVDISKARIAINVMPQLWNEATFRQEHPLSPHKKTESIYLRWPKDYTAYAALYARDYEDKPALRLPIFSSLLLSVEKLIGKSAQRAMIVRLNPNGYISSHIDQGPHAAATDRFHCAIQTNQGSWLKSGDEKIIVLPGEVYWFDKHAMHEAENTGTTPRVHLIVDTLK